MHLHLNTMMYKHELLIAGVHICILASRNITFSEEFHPFLENTSKKPDILVQVSFGKPDLETVEESRVHYITRSKSGEEIIRIESAGLQQSYKLFIPIHLADAVCKHGNWFLYLPLERLLLPRHRIILHASAVIYKGNAYVFTAPSGIGKSTHADIWNREYGAEIINGDKIILAVEDDRIMAYGSPVAGSSGIYKNIGAPVALIAQLKQGKENKIVPSNDKYGFFSLYSGTVKSSYDCAFNKDVLGEIEKIIKKIPIVTLICKPDRGAAQCVLQWMVSKKK